jgi:hypothetical protein
VAGRSRATAAASEQRANARVMKARLYIPDPAIE